MNEEEMRKIEIMTFEINMELEILNNALKYMEMEGINVCSISNFVEKLYIKSNEIIRIF